MTVSITIEVEPKASGEVLTLEMILEWLDPSNIVSASGKVLVLELRNLESANTT